MDFFVLVFLEEEEEGGEQAAKDLSPGVFHGISMKTLNTYNGRHFNGFELFRSLKKSLFISSRFNENTVLCLMMIKTSLLRSQSRKCRVVPPQLLH